MAIVGAGLSGLAAARRLVGGGHRVKVIEKSRGVGGRMATRRKGAARFDHGAQYFTARDQRFGQWVGPWRAAGVVERWDGRIGVLQDGLLELETKRHERLVAVPGMSALCRHLATDLELLEQTRVERLSRIDGGWRLETDAGRLPGAFDSVVLAVPAPQAAELLRDVAPSLASRASAVVMSPCWAAMVSFGEPLDLGFDGAFVRQSPLSWVARNVSKPGRPDSEDWVLHASPLWSREHLEVDKETTSKRLLHVFEQVVARTLPVTSALDAHRWRHALPEPLPEDHLFDPNLSLAACGDWCGGPRVEGAFLSGLAAADALLGVVVRGD